MGDKPNRNFIRVQGWLASEPKATGRVTNLNLPVQSWRRKKDARPDDRYPNETNWFRVCCFSKNDLNVQAAQLRKNEQIIVEGSCEITSWKANDGQERTQVEIHATAIYRVGRDGSTEPVAHPASGGGAFPPRAPANPAASVPTAPAADYFDDGDVPF